MHHKEQSHICDTIHHSRSNKCMRQQPKPASVCSGGQQTARHVHMIRLRRRIKKPDGQLLLFLQLLLALFCRAMCGYGTGASNDGTALWRDSQSIYMGECSFGTVATFIFGCALPLLRQLFHKPLGFGSNKFISLNILKCINNFFILPLNLTSLHVKHSNQSICIRKKQHVFQSDGSHSCCIATLMFLY